MAWFEFVVALLIFFASHSVLIRPPIKPALIKLMGARGFALAYSGLSVAVVAMLIIAAGRAPYVGLWNTDIWMRHMALAVMLVAVLIFVFAIGRPNPLSFGGRNDGQFDPAYPDIVGWLRHPFLVGLGLWAGAHGLANGDVAHLILFGLFAAFAIFGQVLVDRRKRRDLGAEWASLRLALMRRPPWQWTGFGPRLVAGVLVYLGLILLHPLILGVSPLP